MEDNNSQFNLTPRDYEVCLYHHQCPDGIGAAWCFWRENLSKGYITYKDGTQRSILRSDRTISGVKVYEKPPLELVRGKNVVIMDYCFERDDTIELCKVANNVMVLDHHDTSFRSLDGLCDIIPNLKYCLDISRSGAQIAWDWFNPNIREPWFISYIADRDLWKWELENSKQIGKALYCSRWYTFEKMEQLYNLSPEETIAIKHSMYIEGKVLTNIEENDISYAVHKSVLCDFLGYRVRVTTCNPTIRSEVGSSICSKNDCQFAAVWRYDFESDQWWIGLRGDKSCDIALNVLCEKYGGGGHLKACGFAIHGSRSKDWLEASSQKREKMAHGSLHDYFVIVKQS